MESKTKTRTMPKQEADELAEVDASRPVSAHCSDVVDEADDLLAEIDAILEEQSVLTNYRQKGGE